MEDTVSWEVSLPSRREVSFGTPRRATLAILAEGSVEEDISIPVAVGRALRARSKQGKLRAVSRCELLDALTQLQKECAKQRMLCLLERRDMARDEVRKRLARDGYPRFAQDYAIEVGERCGLLDDTLFVERFARSKSLGGWGVHRIEMELGSRGIDVGSLPGWPDDFLDMDDEYERAVAAAERKHVKEPNACVKLARFLVGRGFSYDVAMRAARATL